MGLHIQGRLMKLNICLISFGKTVKNIRQDLSLTQKEVSLKSGVNCETIRRIENGKVIAKFETLELLSNVYKQDLNSIFLKYRIDDYSHFYEVKNELERKLDSGEFNTLDIELRELNSILKSIDNSFYKNLIKQLVLLIEAITLYKDSNTALDKLIDAIKITTPDFSLNEYNSFVYSSIEIRILMNIAFVLNRLNYKEQYRQIMKFCTTSVDSNNDIYPKLCHNLSTAYKRDNNFKKALEYSLLGIKSCQENRNFNGLSILYYGKGVSEYRLNKKEYKESFNISITLCQAFGQVKLKNKIIDNCKKLFNIDLDQKI